MMDWGASHRPPGVTAHVNPARFFVTDPHESRRPSYASSTSKYSQATPRPVHYATFPAMSSGGAKSLGAQTAYSRLGPSACRTPGRQEVSTAKQSVHGNISHVSESRCSIFESPRSAPAPRKQSRGRRPPLAYEKQQSRQSRTRSLSNSFKEGMQKLGSFARRRSSVAKQDIKLVKNTLRGDECGLGKRMSVAEKAVLMENARVREKREQEVQWRAEVMRRVADDLDRYPYALSPRRGLRRVQGAVGLSDAALQASALPRKMRTLSGDTDLMSTFGPLVDAGPQNVESFALRAGTDHKGVNQADSVRHDSVLEQQQQDQSSTNDQIRWQDAERGSIPAKVAKHAIVYETAPSRPGSSKASHHAIKRKPVSPQPHCETLLPGRPARTSSLRPVRRTGELTGYTEEAQPAGDVGWGIGDLSVRADDRGAVLLAEQRAYSAQLIRHRGDTNGRLSSVTNGTDINDGPWGRRCLPAGQPHELRRRAAEQVGCLVPVPSAGALHLSCGYRGKFRDLRCKERRAWMTVKEDGARCRVRGVN